MIVIAHTTLPARQPFHGMDIVLGPGEYAVADHGHRIRTVLGSCVSITLWHAALRIGAMSHFLLPCRGLRGDAREAGLDAHYGDEALNLMRQGLRARGVVLQECEAKVFGGGDMFPTIPVSGARVGQLNGDAARRMLQAQGIEVRGGSLFGQGHREIIFDIASGHVWARQHKLATLQGARA